MDPYWYGEGRDGESLEAFAPRAAKAIEDEILAAGPEKIAGTQPKPVQGAGGVKIAPASIGRKCSASSTSTVLCCWPTRSSRASPASVPGSPFEYYGIRPNLITLRQGGDLWVTCRLQRAP